MPVMRTQAQIGVAALDDAAQPVLAAAGMLPRHQAEPGGELSAALELLEVAYRGHSSGSAHRADTDQRGRLLDGRVEPPMLGNAFIAPGLVLIQLTPLRVCALQRQSPALDWRYPPRPP